MKRKRPKVPVNKISSLAAMAQNPTRTTRRYHQSTMKASAPPLNEEDAALPSAPTLEENDEVETDYELDRYAVDDSMINEEEISDDERSKSGAIAYLLRMDAKFSNALFIPSSRNAALWIECTVHGVPWFVGGSLALVCSVSGRWSYETQHQLVVLNIGLLLDLILNGILKLTTLRRRPAHNINDQTMEAPVVDQYSFPSGHSSRAGMLAVLCGAFFPEFKVAAMALSVLVGVSRVAMGRHYLSDVIAGLVLGWLQGLAVLNLPRSFSAWVRRCLE